MGCLSTWQQLPHERDHSPDSAQSGLDNKASVCAESYGEDDEAAGVKGVCQLGTLSPSGPLPFCRSSPASAALVSLHLSLCFGVPVPLFFSPCVSLSPSSVVSLCHSVSLCLPVAVPLFISVLCPKQRVALSICPPPRRSRFLSYLSPFLTSYLIFPMSYLSLPLDFFASPFLSPLTFLSPF